MNVKHHSDKPGYCDIQQESENFVLQLEKAKDCLRIRPAIQNSLSQSCHPDAIKVVINGGEYKLESRQVKPGIRPRALASLLSQKHLALLNTVGTEVINLTKPLQEMSEEELKSLLYNGDQKEGVNNIVTNDPEATLAMLKKLQQELLSDSSDKG